VSADAADVVVAFARQLRTAGVDASPQQVHAMALALTRLDPSARADVYWAGRLTLCAGPDDVPRYDRVFAGFFDGAGGPAGAAEPPMRLAANPAAANAWAGGQVDGSAALPGSAREAASRLEVLRRRDLAELSAAERDRVARLLAELRPEPDYRRSRRRVPSSRGDVDRHRTLRRLLHAGGEPVRLARQDRSQRPRRVVVLIDVSGSMARYADGYLRWAHRVRQRLTRPAAEVFTLGTRLTRVTRALSHPDPEAALAAVGALIPDWSGGTRLGPTLRRFLDDWGQRGLARGSVVVVMSDGWERGEVAELGEQMARLHRLAHRVVWANPRAGRAGFTPAAAGMAAALPWVDELVSGDSLAALTRLARSLAGPAGRHRHSRPARVDADA
jgi:uncharacterized protein with von Willebrand factor type A (vWA) domain